MKNTLLLTGLLFTMMWGHAQTPGSRDSTFGIYGTAILGASNTSFVSTSMTLQPDGKILVAGYAEANYQSAFTIFRFWPDGTLDDSFGQNGLAQASAGNFENQAYAITLQPDGKILVAGYANTTGTQPEDAMLLRFNADGSLDSSFSGDGITSLNKTPDERFYAIALQPDGKILAAGRARQSNKMNFMVARFLPDGTLDSGYGTNGYTITGFGTTYDVCMTMALQPDGKLVLGGVDVTSNGNSGSFALARYDTTGLLDNTFGANGVRITTIGIGATSSLSSLLIQPDGKILTAGTSLDPGNTPGFIALVRYKATGTPDNTFGSLGKVRVNVGLYSSAESVALLPDGKILVAGRCERSLTKYDMALTQFLPNGAIDSSFGVNGTFFTDVFNNQDGASAIALQPDGRILVAGTGFKLGTKLTSIALTRFIPNLSVGLIDAPTPVEAPLVYPNPVSGDVLNIKYELPGAASVRFEWYTPDGKLLQVSENGERGAGEQAEVLQIPGEAKTGSYILNMRTEKGNAAVRIMIQRD